MRYVDPMTGKQKTKSARTSDRKQAEKIAAKWEADLCEGRYSASSKMTFEDFRELYDRQKLSTLADSSAESAHIALNHLDRLIGPKRLASVTTATITEFQTKLRLGGIRDTSIRSYLRSLKAAFNWSVKQGILVKAPVFDMPRKGRGRNSAMRGRPITAEEYERMVSVVPQVRRLEPEKWQRLLEGLWLSGLRISEALALSWDQDAEIAVWLTGKYPKLRIWGEAQKSGRDQLLPITPDFAEFLLAVPEQHRSGLVFGIEGPQPGKPLTTGRASRYISAFGERAGVVVNKADGKYGSAHDLRRAFGTRWSKKVMPATLQLLMRHKSIDTTLKYYVEQDADDVVADLWAQHAAQGNISGNTTGFPVKVAPDPTSHPNRKPLAQQGVV